jgi:hypothetical protein
VNPVKLSVLGPSGHDLYVRNDTLYVNHGVSGLRIYDYTDHQSLAVIGTLISYLHSGYNHSGWLSEQGVSTRLPTRRMVRISRSVT